MPGETPTTTNWPLSLLTVLRVVFAVTSVNVMIVGSGDVVYYGDPAVERTILGSGTVRRAGAAPS